MYMTEYRNVSLPSVLVEEVEKHLESKGFSSVAEAVKYAVRRWLEELNTRVRPGEGGQEEVPAHAP
jgi:Arc/MetJ-type ribon-helix-helix transcriptional regulator